MPANYFEDLDVALRKQSQNLVDDAIHKLKSKLNKTISLDGALLPGPPRTIILDEAETWGADLIVVGSHGYRAWERFLLGSVSQAVVSHAKCSVEVVRCSRSNRETNHEGKAKGLIACDGSDALIGHLCRTSRPISASELFKKHEVQRVCLQNANSFLYFSVDWVFGDIAQNAANHRLRGIIDFQGGKRHRSSSTGPSRTGDEPRNLYKFDKFPFVVLTPNLQQRRS